MKIFYNKSLFVLANVVNKLAEIYNTSSEEIAKITTKNSRTIFSI